MSYFAPAKIAVGGKALFNQWRRERQRALRNSSDPPEPEETSQPSSPPSPDNLEPDLSPIEVGGTSRGTRSRARASPPKRTKVALMANSAPLLETSTPSAMKMGRFVNSDPGENSMFPSPLPLLRRVFGADQARAGPETDADKRVGYDDHAGDDIDSAHDDEAPRDEQSDAASDSETKPVDDSPSAGDKTTPKEPDIWDPPFSPPSHTRSATHRSSKTPTQRPRSSLRRSVRQASPVADASGQHLNDDDEGKEPVAVGGADAPDPQTKRYKFSSIKDHRPSPGNPNLFELLIRWSLPSDVASDASADDLETWEPEENIHRDAPRSLFAYWKSVGGREWHMEDPGLWHIAAVKKHRVLKGRVQMLVSWVGSGDDSWEPEATVAESAQDILNEYWEERGGSEKCLGEAVTKKTGGAKKRKSAATVVNKGTAKRTRR